MDDLTEKVQSSQTKFEEVVGRIPGYAGYKQKERRREADKILRLHVARKYEEQLKALDSTPGYFDGSLRQKDRAQYDRISAARSALFERLVEEEKAGEGELGEESL